MLSLNVRVPVLCAAWFFSAAVGLAEQDPEVPPVPPGRQFDESRIRVALVDSGVNYLLPSINKGLARDRNGALIGYDFWDMDDRPFDSHPVGHAVTQRHGTRTASIVLREAPFAELVAYRYPRPDMTRMSDLVEHAAANGVRVIGLPLGGNLSEEWSAFKTAAASQPGILFIASAGNNGRNIDKFPVFPAVLPLQNLLVVTSANDFARLAEGVNWGRNHVDYMVPAEHQRVTHFDGEPGVASGSSYAVPRVVALAARLLRDSPGSQAADLMAEIRRRFANGAAPAQLGQGYLFDPQVDPGQSITAAASPSIPTVAVQPYPLLSQDFSDSLSVPLDVMVLDQVWSPSSVSQTLAEATNILSVCGFGFPQTSVRQIAAPEYLHDLEIGAARTLFESVRLSGADRRATVVFARDTRMATPYDAEAFGRANTRKRPWMQDSVWLTHPLQDRGIALAHELFHVLANSGRHSRQAENLMLPRTSGDNRSLTPEQCLLARGHAVSAGLVLQK